MQPAGAQRPDVQKIRRVGRNGQNRNQRRNEQCLPGQLFLGIFHSFFRLHNKVVTDIRERAEQKVVFHSNSSSVSIFFRLFRSR